VHDLHDFDVFQGLTHGGQTSRSSKKGDEFDDVLYGSESESETDDEEGDELGLSNPRNPRKRGFKGLNKQGGAKLRLDDDEPMDLLEGVGMRIEGKFIGSYFYRTGPTDLVGTNHFQVTSNRDESPVKTHHTLGRMSLPER
jgi:hypothetical protein